MTPGALRRLGVLFAGGEDNPTSQPDVAPDIMGELGVRFDLACD